MTQAVGALSQLEEWVDGEQENGSMWKISVNNIIENKYMSQQIIIININSFRNSNVDGMFSIRIFGWVIEWLWNSKMLFQL